MDVTSAEMTNLFGDMTPLSSVLPGIFEVRIISSEFGGTRNGDSIESTLGMDNLRALTLPGDANFDNTVNTADFSLLAASFNQSGKTWGDGDFDFDGKVNALDFSTLAKRQHFCDEEVRLNRRLAPDVETLFLMTGEESFYVSSSLVKEVALMGGDVSGLVPPAVARALSERAVPDERG
jgi:hypothetical protein